MTDKVLDELVSGGCIVSYKLDFISEDGVVGEESGCRNTEQLTLNFPNGKMLKIGTFCSGCLENTVLTFPPV